MAQKENKSVTVLSYSVDDAAISRVLKATDKVEKAIETSVGGLGDYAPATKLAMRSVEASFQNLDLRLADHGRTVDEITMLYRDLERAETSLADSEWLDELRAETSAAEQAATAYDNLADSKQSAARTSGGGGAGGSALDVADNAASKAGQILSGLGQGEAANAAGLIGDTLSAITAFGPAAGVAAAAGGAIALVMGEINRQWEEGKKKAEDYAARLNALAQMTAGGATSEDYQRQIDEAAAAKAALEADNAALQAYQANVQSIQDTIVGLINNPLLASPDLEVSKPYRDLLEQARDAEQQLFAGLPATFGSAITGYDQLNRAIEVNQANIDQYASDIETLGLEMRSAGVLENDRRAQLEAEQAAADAAARREMEINAELDSMTSDQRRAKIQELIKEREALQLAASYTGLSTEYQNELAASLADVNERINIFASDVWTTADALDASAKAAEELEAVQARYSDATDDVFQATTAVVEAYEKAAKATEEYNQAIAEHEANLAQIEADRIAKRDELRTKAAEDEIKAEEATAKKLRDIQRKADLSMLSAIANRDALAYKQAKDAAEEQIKTETDSLAERKKELRDALEEQLDDQDKAARQAVAREEQRWNEERAVRIRANQLALVDVQNAENAQRAARQNANVAALALMEMRATGEAQIYSDMAMNADFWLTYMENRSAAAWAAIAAAMGGSGIGGGAGGAQPTPFADGGLVTSSGLAMLHAPEVIVPLRPAGKAPLSSTTTIHQNAGGVTLNIAGSTPGQIRREVDRQLDGYFRKAGFYD